MGSLCKTMPKNWLRALNSTSHPAGYIFLRYLSVEGTPDRPGASGNNPQTNQNRTAASNNDQVRNSREGTARIPSTTTTTTTSQKSTGEGGRVREAIADATTDTTKLELLISKS